MAENWIEKAGLEKFALDTANKLHFNRMSDENPSIILKAFKKVAKAADYLELQSELSKAQEKIKELEGLLKRVEPLAGSGLYREITEALYVPREQND